VRKAVIRSGVSLFLTKGNIAALTLCAAMTGAITGLVFTYVAFQRLEPAVADLELKALLQKQVRVREKERDEKAVTDS